MADTDAPFQWNVDMEVGLFHAMRGHKPVGVNRHFQMICIQEKLNNSCNRRITTKQIWEHLSQMFDLQALNESEIIPFPNKELDFGLPDTEYSDLMNEDFQRTEKTSYEEKKHENKLEHKEMSTGVVSVKPFRLEKADKHLTSSNSENSPKRKRTRQTPSDNSTKRRR